MPTHNEAMQEAIAALSAQRARLPYARNLAIILRCARARRCQCRRRHGVRDRSGAPRDGGAMVTFIACPFMADYPEQGERRRKTGTDEATKTTERPVRHLGLLLLEECDRWSGRALACLEDVTRGTDFLACLDIRFPTFANPFSRSRLGPGA
jgi:hypothetical protein